jgi:hypothetical protein
MTPCTTIHHAPPSTMHHHPCTTIHTPPSIEMHVHKYQDNEKLFWETTPRISKACQKWTRQAWWVDVKTYLTCMKWLENGWDIHSRVQAVLLLLQCCW